MFGEAAAVFRSLTASGNVGTAAIEFALFLPFFVLIIAGTIDLGYLVYTATELSAALGAGSLYAANNATLVSTALETLQSNIQTVVTNANGTGWATSLVNINNGDANHCYCPTGLPGNWTWGTIMTCGMACPSGGVAGQFVAITASHTVLPLFPAFGFAHNGTITRSVMVETQ